MFTRCSVFVSHGRGMLKSPLIKMITGHYVKVTERGLTSDWGEGRGEFRPRQTRQLPRAVDLKGRLLSCQSY